MGTILLLDVDPDTRQLLREAVGPRFAFEACDRPDDALALLEENSDAIDLAVLGSTLDEPVRVAQQIGVRRRQLPIMLLAEARRYDQLVRAIQFSPFLSSAITCQTVEDHDQLAQAFKENLLRARRQHQYEQMLESANARLDERASTAPSPTLYLDRLLDHAPVGVVVIDDDGRIRAWNRHASTIFGLSEREAMNRRLLDLFPAPERNRLRSFISDRTANPEQSLPETFERATRMGDIQYVDVTATAITGRNSEPGVMVIFQDVTKRVEAEHEARRLGQEIAVAAALAAQAEQLQQLNQELEQRNRELQDFAYVASHDLQEPLRKIRAFADLLATDYQDVIDEEGQHYLRRVQDAAGRMSALLSALLEYSRVATRSRPFERVDLNRLAAEVASDLQILRQEVGGRIEIEPLPEIEADPVQVRQLLQNLVSNGLKFHRPEVPPIVRITGHLEKQDGKNKRTVCRVEVSDNGIGFDEKYLDRIFAPFERLHGRDDFAGTGMGLAICRRIVERHQGEITAVSEEGVGSTFIVTLPVMQS